MEMESLELKAIASFYETDPIALRKRQRDVMAKYDRFYDKFEDRTNA